MMVSTIITFYMEVRSSLAAQVIKNLLAMQETLI